MPPVEKRNPGPVPPRALGISVAALAVPVAAAFWTPESLLDYAALMWLLALMPAFLLAYYRGWSGVATALAMGMATLSVTQAVVLWLQRPLPDLLLGVVVAYLAISLCIGWLAEAYRSRIDDAMQLAFTDLLTELPNRRHARTFLSAEFAAAERGRPLAVVLFDLDGFKAYNDRWGHGAGDDALIAFSRVLEENTRQMNLSARFGGEEFLTVLSGSEEEGAAAFAERVRAGFLKQGLSRGALTVSAGVASYHYRMDDPDQLLAAADVALYRAKDGGRNQVHVFDENRLDDRSQWLDRSGSEDGHGAPGGA